MQAPSSVAVLEVALHADDLDAATAFHGRVPGLPDVGRQEGRHVVFRRGPTVVPIVRTEETVTSEGPGRSPVPAHGTFGAGHIRLAADAEALDRWKARLPDCGVAIEAEFAWSGGAPSVHVRDPAGNSVEFAEPRLRAPE